MKVTDEMIVAAVVSSRTNKEAAGQLGLSESQLYERMHSAEYRDLLNTTIEAHLESVAGRLRDKTIAAIDTITEIAESSDVPPSVRLAAASALLQHYVKLETVARSARANIDIDREKEMFSLF